MGPRLVPGDMFPSSGGTIQSCSARSQRWQETPNLAWAPPGWACPPRQQVLMDTAPVRGVKEKALGGAGIPPGPTTQSVTCAEQEGGLGEDLVCSNSCPPSAWLAHPGPPRPSSIVTVSSHVPSVHTKLTRTRLGLASWLRPGSSVGLQPHQGDTRPQTRSSCPPLRAPPPPLAVSCPFSNPRGP